MEQKIFFFYFILKRAMEIDWVVMVQWTQCTPAEGTRVSDSYASWTLPYSIIMSAAAYCPLQFNICFVTCHFCQSKSQEKIKFHQKIQPYILSFQFTFLFYLLLFIILNSNRNPIKLLQPNNQPTNHST